MRKLIAVLFACFALITPAAMAQTPEPAVSIDKPMLPDFACTDTSYADAVANGITLGITPDFPYTYLDSDNEPQGIDVAINKAVLDWIGITDVTFETMPWDSLIPALQAEQIDVIADNIHETPDRVKVIGFSSPAWWYGPALIVTSDNPDNIQSYDDLTREGVTVGAVSGSAAAEYLNFIGADVTTFKDNTAEFAAAEQGRVSVTLEDDTKFAAYAQQNDSTNLTALDVDAPEILVSEYGYSYARYGLRQSDCTLNFAYSRALAEMRDNGQIGAILEQFGLPKSNVWLPGVAS
ncbi:MAG TPA: transporter substrate-binding domain-containing protein [Thermomicrobiales bacterium]|nr:transporter substrate-binding domain-containing protein [Thermomicrobiales bacterium]